MATPAIGSVDLLLADQHLAGVERQETVDAAQQRGLAAARRADDGDDLALADVEIDVAEDFERAVVLAQALDANARRVAVRRLQRGARAFGGCQCRWTGHSATCLTGLVLILAQ